MLTVTIDWLAGTFKEYTYEAEAFFNTYARFPTREATKPRNGYTVAEVDDCGTVTMWDVDYTSMGYHVVFAGSALRNLRERHEIQADALLRAFINAGGRVSRLDLAKDLQGQAVDMQGIYQSLEQGNNKGTARNFARIVSNGGGDTIYVGSRQSEKFIRLYDKAMEQGIMDTRWFRLEVETKAMVARAVAQSLVQTKDWAGVFDTVVVSMVNGIQPWDNSGFFPAGKVDVGLPKIEKKTDREKWIEEQVISAVAKHYIENPTSIAVSRLIETLALIDRQRKV